MKISRVITLIVLAAFAGVVATGALQAQTKEPIKVGMIQPLSGPIAAAGSYITNGAKIALDRVNAKGGVLGRPLELIIEDFVHQSHCSSPTAPADLAPSFLPRMRWLPLGALS